MIWDWSSLGPSVYDLALPHCVFFTVVLLAKLGASNRLGNCQFVGCKDSYGHQ